MALMTASAIHSTNILRIGRYGLTLILVAPDGMFLHEGGHGLAAASLDGEITYQEVMPRMQLYPQVELHARHPISFDRILPGFLRGDQ